MTSAGLFANPKPRVLCPWKALAAGWTAAGAVSWLAAPSRTAHLHSWSELLRASIGCTVATVLAAALVARLSRSPSKDYLYRVAASAGWFAPLAVFLSGRSLWAALATAVLAASAVTLLHPVPHPHSEVPQRRSLLALCAALAMQTGAIAVFLNRAWTAAVLAALSAALLTWLLIGNRQSAPAASWRSALLLTASALFTAGGLVRYLPLGSGVVGPDGGSMSAGDLVQRLGSEGTANVVVGDVYPGVILWPEVQQYASLVPPLPALGHGFNLSKTHPLSIPFFGAYWFYKDPDHRLPADPFQTHGDPAAITFRSTDHRPMRMEAHQNLGTLIDLSCCSRMEAAIRNGDRYPGSVSLEIILINTTIPGRPSQSLGTATVMSIPRGHSAPEILRFPIPAASKLRKFDEIVVVFKLTAMRVDRSARIALNRFLLVPNGL